MKTTVVIADTLLKRAHKVARARGTTLRALVEAGLLKVLEEQPPAADWEPKDCSVGSAKGAWPLDGMSWDELRTEIYGSR